MEGDASAADSCLRGPVIGGVLAQGIEQRERVPGHPKVTLDEVIDRGFQGPGDTEAQGVTSVSGHDCGIMGGVDARAAGYPGPQLRAGFGEHAGVRLRR